MHTPTEVELFLGLASARDFAMGCHELIDLADGQVARLDSQPPAETAGRAAQALGVPLALQEHVHRIFAETEQDLNAVLRSTLERQEINVEQWAADPFAALAQLVNPDPAVARFAGRVQAGLAGDPAFTYGVSPRPTSLARQR